MRVLLVVSGSVVAACDYSSQLLEGGGLIAVRCELVLRRRLVLDIAELGILFTYQIQGCL